MRDTTAPNHFCARYYSAEDSGSVISYAPKGNLTLRSGNVVARPSTPRTSRRPLLARLTLTTPTPCFGIFSDATRMRAGNNWCEYS